MKKRIIKWFSLLLFTVGMLGIILLSENKYQWMQDMDPEIIMLPQDNSNHSIIVGLIAFILMINQIIMYFISDSRVGKLFSSFGMFLLLIIWLRG